MRVVHEATVEATETETRLVLKEAAKLSIAGLGLERGSMSTREWQKQRIAAGLCKECGRVREVYAHRCNECQERERKRWLAASHKYNRSRHGPGRPPRHGPKRLKLKERTHLRGAGIDAKASRFLDELERKQR